MLTVLKLRSLHLLIFTGFIICVQLYALKMLDYSTSSIKWFCLEEGINAPPLIDEFQLGNLKWDFKLYSEAPN